MNKRTYRLAAWIFIGLGLLTFLIRLASGLRGLTVILISCFVVGVIYLIISSRQKD
ncbi:MAG: hypothetical protein ACRC8A_02465 [Microcoleaceae cyanobacterium]